MSTFHGATSDIQTPEEVDKRTLSSLTALVERIEAAVARNEAIAKNQEELAVAVFETLLDDDGSIKDFTHSEEVKAILHKNWLIIDKGVASVGQVLKTVPTSVEARLCEEDRLRLDKNLQSWHNVFKLHLPFYSVVGFIVGLCIPVSVLAPKSATDKRLQYEHRLEQLDHWEQQLNLRDPLLHRYPLEHRDYPTKNK